MNLGTENKNKTIAAIALGVLALGMVIYRFLSPTGGPPPLPAANQSGVNRAATNTSTAPRPQTRGTRANTRAGNTKKVVPASLDPTLRLALLQVSEETKYAGRGRNIFQNYVEVPKIVQAPVQQPPVTAQPQGPPPPPPINLKFFGFASKPGEPKRIFLSSGEDVFIAAEGDIVNRRYKVLRISPSSVEIEDVLNNNRQSIPLTQG